jgi:hypothetical protein
MFRDRRGAAAFEFCIIASVLLGLMLAAFDFGNFAQQQVALHQALRSGGEFARFFPTKPGANGAGAAPCTDTTVRCTVLNALPSGWTLSTLSMACTCAGTSVSCTSPGTCSPPFLMTIQASMPSIAVMTWLWTGGAITNQASYEVRIQ